LLVRLTLLMHPQGDLFGLTGLSQGVCPAKNKLEWLPPRPSAKPGEVFRARAPNSMVWYEHLSKAGGTSFCKLAQKNMKRPEVPSYYCMPSMPEEGEQFKFDARVGQWDNGKLVGYFQNKGHVRGLTPTN